MKSLIIASIISISLFLLIILFPVNSNYSVYNHGQLGLSDFYSSFTNTKNSNVTILIIIQFYNINISYFENYLAKGGILILSGNYTLVNLFLKDLNQKVLIGNSIITNSLCYYYNPSISLVKYQNLTLVFPYPHEVIGGNPLIKINNIPIVSYVNYGKGKIIVISSEDYFVNEYFQLFNNSVFIHNLTGSNYVRIIIASYPNNLALLKSILSL